MNQDFWHERWQADEIGFHNSHVHPLLKRYWPTLKVAGGRVFVPLCGKSRDMVWLAEQGRSVVGCELSPIAVQAFFADCKLVTSSRQNGPVEQVKGGPYELLVGDFFALTAGLLPDVSAVYDRAALIALPADIRSQYVDHLHELINPGSQLLLITLEHDGEAGQGPPFSVAEDEVTQLFKRWTELTRVGTCESDLRGHAVTEQCFVITK